MSIVNFESCADSSEFDADICIVGSGPAGLTIALQFVDSPCKIIVVESGGITSDPHTDLLSEIESVGMARAPQNVTRSRGLGGTSALWSGRCGVFDAMDFQARSWVPHSGWPIGADDLQPYFDRAGQILGLGPGLYGEDQSSILATQDTHAWDPLKLRSVVWQFSRHERNGAINHFAKEGVEGAKNLGMLQHSGAPKPRNIGEFARDALALSTTIQILINATATEILSDQRGLRAVGVKIASLSGQRGIVRAGKVILACGAIDNARLMLSSRSSSQNGIGNAHGNVGRYLSDHPFWPIARYDGTGSVAARRSLGTRWLSRHGEKHVYVFGLRFSPELQRHEQLLNTALHIAELGHEPPAISHLGTAMRHLKRRQLGRPTWQALSKALAHPLQLLSGIYSHYIKHQPPLTKPTTVSFGAVVEQVPDPDSRVTLSEQLDALDMPRARVDWRVSVREFDNARRMADLIAEEFDRLGLEKPRFASWLGDKTEAFRQHIHDMAHPMSTTRMSADPSAGVVDANCQVHGVAGLYVAGASVFSTSGYMNPTLMIVALSLRLADHLKSAMPERTSASAAPRALSARQRPARLGIIGAGNRIRNIYLPIFRQLPDQFDIVGVTSRSTASAEQMSELTRAPPFDHYQDLVAKTRPDFLLVAVNSIDDFLPGLLTLGTPLLIETPFCWNLRAGRRALAEIKKQSLLVGIAEQFPELPDERLKRKVIELGLIGSVFAAQNDFCSYDYHGLAAARRYLSGLQGGATVNAVSQTQQPLSGNPAETWLAGMIRFHDGGLLMHNYSDSYFDSPFRSPRQFRAYGTSGSIVGDRMLFANGSAPAMKSTILRNDVDGRLQSLAVDTPLGPITWDNPFAHIELSDEQIAVATMLRQMSLAAQFGGVPTYSAQDSFDEMERLAAMRASARRSGAPVTVPISAAQEIVEKLAARLT